MTSPAPHEIYRTHMAEAKLRILSAERVFKSAKPILGLAAFDMEFCFLQIRRVVEAVTFSAMVREATRYTDLRVQEGSASKRDHGDASKDWQAPDILKRLVGLSPHALPIPFAKATEVQPGLVHYDREGITVNHGRLIELYEKSGGFLHGKNPLGSDFSAMVESERQKYIRASVEVGRALDFLRRLLWKHAAITLEASSSADPRELSSPRSAWLVEFGQGESEQVNLIVAEAV